MKSRSGLAALRDCGVLVFAGCCGVLWGVGVYGRRGNSQGFCIKTVSVSSVRNGLVHCGAWADPS